MPFEIVLIVAMVFGSPIAVTALILKYLRQRRTLTSVSKEELTALREEIARMNDLMEERFADLTLMLEDGSHPVLPTPNDGKGDE